MLILKILGFLLMVPGFITVFAAKKLVAKYHLEQKAKCSFSDEMTEEELQQYKVTKAIVNVKMVGFLVALPGIVMILIAFR